MSTTQKAAEEPKQQAEEPKKKSQPIRAESVELEGDFEGWTFTANKNFTFGEFEELASFNYYRMVKTLKRLVLGWENFADRDGKELKFVPQATLTEAYARHEAAQQNKSGAPLADLLPPTDPWNDITTDLLVAMTRAILGLPSLPNR